MNTGKIHTLLVGMAAINKLLAAETAGDGYFEAVTDRMTDTLIMAGVGLDGLLRCADDTQEDLPAIVCENFEDTREMPAVRVYEVNGTELDTAEMSK